MPILNFGNYFSKVLKYGDFFFVHILRHRLLRFFFCVRDRLAGISWEEFQELVLTTFRDPPPPHTHIPLCLHTHTHTYTDTWLLQKHSGQRSRQEPPNSPLLTGSQVRGNADATTSCSLCLSCTQLGRALKQRPKLRPLPVGYQTSQKRPIIEAKETYFMLRPLPVGYQPVFDVDPIFWSVTVTLKINNQHTRAKVEGISLGR